MSHQQKQNKQDCWSLRRVGQWAFSCMGVNASVYDVSVLECAEGSDSWQATAEDWLKWWMKTWSTVRIWWIKHHSLQKVMMNEDKKVQHLSLERDCIYAPRSIGLLWFHTSPLHHRVKLKKRHPRHPWSLHPMPVVRPHTDSSPSIWKGFAGEWRAASDRNVWWPKESASEDCRCDPSSSAVHVLSCGLPVRSCSPHAWSYVERRVPFNLRNPENGKKDSETSVPTKIYSKHTTSCL